MTKLFADAVRKVSKLPKERQEDAAHILFTMIENDTSKFQLNGAQLREVDQAIKEVDAGRFASDKAIADVLLKPWA